LELLKRDLIREKNIWAKRKDPKDSQMPPKGRTQGRINPQKRLIGLKPQKE